MATKMIKVTVVEVGQGQCTFIETYDTDLTKPKHVLLIDCGSDKRKDKNSNEESNYDDNLTYIANTVKKMQPKPVFDCIFFSHSDKDHTSLTFNLLAKFTELQKKDFIKKIWYGGNRKDYTKGTDKKNILNFIEANGYCKTENIKKPKNDSSGYSPDNHRFARNFWESDDKEVTVYSIVANTLSNNSDDDRTSKKTAESKNRISIVCGLYYNDCSYIICGDATNISMARISSIFKGTSVFNNNLMTTLPHHGSRSTGFAVKSGVEPSDDNIKVVKNFAKLLKSKTLTVSAFKKHRHPSLQLMNHFIPTDNQAKYTDKRLKQSYTHRLTAYFDIDIKNPNQTVIKPNGVDSFDTNSNTFSTYYTKPKVTCFYRLGTLTTRDSEGVMKLDEAINPFACWQYINTPAPADEWLLNSYPNLLQQPTLQLRFSKSEDTKPEEEPERSDLNSNAQKKAKISEIKLPVSFRSAFSKRLQHFR